MSNTQKKNTFGDASPNPSKSKSISRTIRRKTGKTEPKQEELYKQVPIKDTPFHAVKMEDNWFLTMGKYRLSEKLPSLDACMKDAADASWIRIMQIMNIMIEEHEVIRGIKEGARKEAASKK